ncbi:MAG: Hint domain-containing protein, partial [Plesiomonas shigelloides]
LCFRGTNTMAIYNIYIYDLSTNDKFGTGGSFDTSDGLVTVPASRIHNINVEDDNNKIDDPGVFNNESTPWNDATYGGGGQNSDTGTIQTTFTLSDGTVVGPGWTLTARSGEGGVTNVTTGQTGYITNLRLDPPPGTDLPGFDFRFVNAFVGVDVKPNDVLQATNDAGDSSNGTAFYSGLGVPCFARGTMIRTQNGDVAVENLSTDDLVLTVDRGYQPVRWIGSRRIGAAELMAFPKLRPIRIAAGSLGELLPRKELVVSAQHRILISSRLVERMTGVESGLTAAKNLLSLPGITVDHTVVEVEYYHILFDAHELIYANGALAESLLLGEQALSALSEETRQEIAMILFGTGNAELSSDPVREIIKGAKARKIVSRSVKSGHQLAIGSVAQIQ